VFASTRDVSTGELYLVNADGTGLTRLTNDLSPDRDPAWSPDGSQLAWVQGSGGGQLLRVMKADGTLLPGFICGGGSGPAWSRGGKVAFVYADGDIYVANPDGTGLERRTYDGMYQPYSDLAWSPVWNSPGPELAYTRGGEIYIQGRQLTAGGGRNAAWSPNGAKIAFVSDRAGNPEIYVVNYDGSGLTRLTTNAAADVEPTWSSDGTKLAFVSDRDGVRDLYVMNADGSGVTRIPVGGRASRPRWRP
jgi:Tol biopolymer transport system component